MTACLLCREPPSLGLLCIHHGGSIAIPGLISEQILSSVAQPTASLIDPWGFAHPVASGAVIGRDPASGLAILHPSISSTHAELRWTDGAWAVIDRQSRNGSSVDGAAIEPHRPPAVLPAGHESRPAIASARLRPGALVGFGGVRLYFWPRALGNEPRPTGKGRTAPSTGALRGFGATARTAGGVGVELRARGDGGLATVDAETIDLARKEFALLQVLAERRAQRDAEHAYVPWHELAACLDFDSAEADSENVRALVRRVRKKLEPVARDLIESKHGVGYRLAGAVALELERARAYPPPG